MSREIKFRYFYKDGIHKSNKVKTIILTLEDIESGKAKELHTILCREQYTGLKDKNKEEIYEGDIVQIDDVLGKIITTYIYYSLGAFRYRHDDGSGSVLDMITTSKVKGYKSVTKDIEVIGNIYENPERLKQLRN